jgi:DNA-binding transcriptional ArsR family regulator
MVESKAERLDHVFHALAHPARREILRRLSRGEHTIAELARPFDMSLEAVSKHVQVLERARLLRRTRSGRSRRCSFKPAPLRDAQKLLSELSSMWNRRFDALEKLLAEPDGKD